MTDAAKRRAPILDGRLSAAMALAENSRAFADIGADHGRLTAVMLLADDGRRALAADISALALEKARRRLTGLGLEGRVVFAVSDGLEALERMPTPPVDTVFILGMGGDTIRGILLRGADRLRGAALILSPQTEPELVREALVAIGYRIRREQIVRDAGRDYLMLRAQPARKDEPVYTEEELLLGPLLLHERPAEWLPVLQRRERLLRQGIRAMQQAGHERDQTRLALAQRQYGYVVNALARYGKDGGSC